MPAAFPRTTTPSTRHRKPRRSRSAPPPARTEPAPVELSPARPPVASFAAAKLPQPLVTALQRRGIAEPFPIQAATLPDALAGADVLGRAETGSGKTLAFGLPLLARLGSGARRGTRRPAGLVLVPTRELARQVTDVLAPLGQPLGVRVTAVYGGASMGRQISVLGRGCDIVVATPGRLVDLIERRAVHLDAVDVAVLDEADHLCDLGFLPVVRRLLAMVPVGGQRMLFSATLDGDVDVLVREFLDRPVLVDIAPAQAAAPVTHQLVDVDAGSKNAAVTDLARGAERALLFVRSRHRANRLAASLLSSGIRVRPLHGGLAQSARNHAIAEFASGDTKVLVATDVAARGLHVEGLDLVVHVDPPHEPKAFLHRSGRTARAGASGTVITLVLPDERHRVTRLLHGAGIVASQRPATTGERSERSERPERAERPRHNRANRSASPPPRQKKPRRRHTQHR